MTTTGDEGASMLAGELGRRLTVLEAAAYMAWADRRLAPDELSATRGVATVLGLGAAGAGMLSRTIEASSLDFSALDARGRELAYAAAVWIALADGVLAPSEQRALRILQGRLGLSPERCEELEELVHGWAGPGEAWDRRFASVVHQLGVG
jgi:tellurite resistance protein